MFKYWHHHIHLLIKNTTSSVRAALKDLLIGQSAIAVWKMNTKRRKLVFKKQKNRWRSYWDAQGPYQVHQSRKKLKSLLLGFKKASKDKFWIVFSKKLNERRTSYMKLQMLHFIIFDQKIHYLIRKFQKITLL